MTNFEELNAIIEETNLAQYGIEIEEDENNDTRYIILSQDDQKWRVATIYPNNTNNGITYNHDSVADLFASSSVMVSDLLDEVSSLRADIEKLNATISVAKFLLLTLGDDEKLLPLRGLLNDNGI